MVHQVHQELQDQVVKMEHLVHRAIVELRVVRGPRDRLAHLDRLAKLEQAERLVVQARQAVQELQALLVHLEHQV